MGLRSDVTRRGAVYYFRRRLPRRLGTPAGRTHVTFSLRTRCPGTARQRAARAGAALEGRLAMKRDLDRFTDADLKAISACALYGYVEAHEGWRALGVHPEKATGPETWRAALDESIAAVKANLRDNTLAYGPQDATLLLDALGVDHRRDSQNYLRLARMLERAALKAYEVERRRADGDEPDEVALPDLSGCRSFTPDDMARLLDEPTAPDAPAPRADGPDRRVAETPADSPDDGRDDALTVSRAQVGCANERRLGGAWDAKSCAQSAESARLFADLVADKPIGDISAADVRRFKEALAGLPAKYAQAKPFKDLRPHAALAEARRLAERDGGPGIRCLSAKTINKHVSFMRSIVGWANPTAQNPFAFASIKTPKKGAAGRRAADSGQTRRPFTDDELRRFFSSPVYAGFAHAKARFKPGRRMLRDARFYVPLIAAYSGMRLEEICQLRSEDIGVAEDVPCMFVRAGDGRRIKTANAHRAVPIHPVLVDAGLLEHRDRMAGDASGLLFPELGFTRDGQPSPLGPRERHGDAISTWFGHYCTRIGLSDPALVFHSFRHGFIQRLFNTAGVEEAKVKAIVGHANEGESHESYFRGYAPGVLADTVGALAYGIEDDLRAQLQNPRLSFARRYPAARVRRSRGA